MPSTTPINKIPYPLLTDPPNAPDQFSQLATKIDPYVPFSAANAAARDALVAAGGGVKAGMICLITGGTLPILTVYSGGAWRVMPIGNPLVQTNRVTLPITAAGAFVQVTWNFPIPFSAAPTVTATVVGGSLLQNTPIVGVAAATTALTTISGVRSTGTAAFDAMVIAVGLPVVP